MWLGHCSFTKADWSSYATIDFMNCKLHYAAQRGGVDESAHSAYVVGQSVAMI